MYSRSELPPEIGVGDSLEKRKQNQAGEATRTKEPNAFQEESGDNSVRPHLSTLAGALGISSF